MMMMNQIPFDHMDISDSIRSSSPDSLLSSSNLQDDDDDIDMNNEVEQWNDDLILNTTPASNINQENSSRNLHLHPIDQVDFIDTSRSNSRCSNASSHLSGGYADQARQFLSDDGELLTSSESDNDDDDEDDNLPDFKCDTISDVENEDLCLQVNLDHHHSHSPFSQSNSTRSSSPIPDETPILDIDEENNESKPLQNAPIAALDDDDDDDDTSDLPIFISDQPVLPYLPSNIKNLIELKVENRQNDLVRDIIHMRHLFNENNHNDEFLAIMHNPKIFEEVLSDENPKVIFLNHRKESTLESQIIAYHHYSSLV